MAALSPADRLARYAQLTVRVGANVQPGQTVFVLSQIEHAPLARAITTAAYEAGATYVDVAYRDQHVRKAMIELGPDEAEDVGARRCGQRLHCNDGRPRSETARRPRR
jgi:leucyl aminopeptidase (aminopeptidase T)